MKLLTAIFLLLIPIIAFSDGYQYHDKSAGWLNQFSKDNFDNHVNLPDNIPAPDYKDFIEEPIKYYEVPKSAGSVSGITGCWMYTSACASPIK